MDRHDELRLLNLARTAIAATQAVDHFHDADESEPGPRTVESFMAAEDTADKLVRRESESRLALIDELVDLVGTAPRAVLLPGGILVTVTGHADGLAIIEPARITRLEERKEAASWA